MMRLVIAGTNSGVGKTTLTAGLTAALVRRGMAVQPFKAGPDYIDPTYHTLAAGRPCRNLDAWMVPPERVKALFAHIMRDADLALIEGVMGIYDGLGYDDDSGSTAQVAKLLDAPVVLVIDAGRMGRSAAAVALGCQRFDPDLSLAGYIVNRVGSDKHGHGVARAVERATGLPVFGWVPREESLDIPERHLGLVPTAEPGRWQAFLEAAADQVAQRLDIDGLLTVARRAPTLSTPDLSTFFEGMDRDVVTGGGRPVIAVAHDEAFSFTYRDNLDLLQAAGADLAFFSPVHDRDLPPRSGAVDLSGGFPELYAGQLAANRGVREALREAHRRDLPIYAECGGLMYLTETIMDLEGYEHEMVGLLPGRSTMTAQLRLGYREAEAATGSWLLARGEAVRGHEFHFSVWDGRPSDLPSAYVLHSPGNGGERREEGACLGSLWASYVHLHFWSKPELAMRFVLAAGKQ